MVGNEFGRFVGGSGSGNKMFCGRLWYIFLGDVVYRSFEVGDYYASRGRGGNGFLNNTIYNFGFGKGALGTSTSYYCVQASLPFKGEYVGKWTCSNDCYVFGGLYNVFF